MASAAEQLLEILAPLDRAYGTSPPEGSAGANGKRAAKYQTIKPRDGEDCLLTPDIVDKHLENDESAIGVFPLRDDGLCKFGVIDIDEYADPYKLAKSIAKKNLPFVMSRSKSGGLHLSWIVPKPVPATEMRRVLGEWAYSLGLDAKTEIFPKSDKLPDRGSYGNFINLFLAGIRSGKTDRAVLDSNGEPFTNEHDAIKHLYDKVSVLRSPTASDGPPCLQQIAVEGQDQGDRNNVLFNFAIYAYKKDEEEFADSVDEFNREVFSPPLGSKEVSAIIHSVEKGRYHYKCDIQACADHCDRARCATRQFGIAQHFGEADPDGAVLLPSNHFSGRESATEIYRRLADAGTCFLRGDTVAEIHDDKINPISSQAFRSTIEALGPTYRLNQPNQHGIVARQRRQVSNDNAQQILACPEKREHLSPINLVSKYPLMQLDGSIMAPGYNEGGVYITSHHTVPEIPYDEAVKNIVDVFDDFDFVTDADRSRNFAMVLTAGLRMSGLLTGPIPIDYSEAEQSQAGKTLRQAAIRSIYGCDQVPIVPRKQQGTGSFDETLGEHLYKGHPFAPMDNVRGRIDSELIEALCTAPSGVVVVRIPHIGSVEIDVSRCSLQISSNGVTMTPDLANRCCIVRIRKRQKGAAFAHDDLLAHIAENREKYLGSALAVISDWIRRGRPMKKSGQHDMRIWDRALSEIVEHAGLAPMMTGHQEIKERTASPTKNWLRQVAFHMEPENTYTVTDLIDISEAHDIELPVKRGEKISMILGKKLASAFTENQPVVVIDDLEISREIKKYSKTDSKGKVIGSGKMKVYRCRHIGYPAEDELPY
jgi:hypothetical protein